MREVHPHVGGDQNHADLTIRRFTVDGAHFLDKSQVEIEIRKQVPDLGPLTIEVDGNEVIVRSPDQNLYVAGGYRTPEGKIVDRQTAIELALAGVMLG